MSFVKGKHGKRDQVKINQFNQNDCNLPLFVEKVTLSKCLILLFPTDQNQLQSIMEGILAGEHVV